MVVRKLVKLEEDTINFLQDIAKFFGVKEKDILESYVNSLGILSRALRHEGEFLRTHLKLKGKDLVDFAISRVLSLSELYVIIKALDDILGIWRMGFVLEDVFRYKTTDYIQGVTLCFESPQTSQIFIDSIDLTIGIEIDSFFYGRGAKLEADLTIGYREGLGKQYDTIKNKLEKSIDRLGPSIERDLEEAVYGMCDEGEANVELVDYGEILAIHVDVFAEDITCLPKIDRINKAIAKIIRRAGLKDLIIKSRS